MKCDCLNVCGDDPRLRSVKWGVRDAILAEQCEGYTRMEQQAAADEIWNALTAWRRTFG